MKRDIGVDVRAELQRRLLEAIAQGGAPWDYAEQWEAAHALPFNAITQLPYGGGNAVSLILEQTQRRLRDPRWLSAEQGRAAGHQLRPDAEPVPLEFWKRDAAGLRSETIVVYNAADFITPSGETLSDAVPLDRAILRRDPIERAEQILAAAGARIEHVAGVERPTYDPDTDTIVMPTRDRFVDGTAYYQAALAPLATASAMAAGVAPDLIASRLQIAKMFVAIETGIVIDEAPLAQEWWLERIQSDKHFVYRAARDAGRIADYMVGLAPDRTLAQEQVIEAGLKLIGEPEVALRELTADQSTFSRKELERYVRAHTADTRQYAQLMNAIATSPSLVQLDRNGARFTSSDVFEVERTIVSHGDLLARSEHRGVDPLIVDRVLDQSVLGEQQRSSLRHITGPGSLANVIGYAGTGKSRMLGDARVAWEEAGFRVRGIALSGIAAEGLEDGAGIPSRTIASQEFAWDNGREPLGPHDILVVDEAGMIGSRGMARLLTVVYESQAKIVLVGDPKQLQAIEAGAAFRALIDRHGAARITEIRRQQVAWQRDASIDFAEGRIDQALAAYERHGNTHAAKTPEQARAELIARWAAARRENPEKTQIILAYTRRDVHDLNERARAIMRDRGELGEDHEITTAFGTLNVAVGDRLYFRKNDKNLGVKNGTLGTVERVDDESLIVNLDMRGRVEFKLEDYNSLTRGLAATVHRSQGVTVDRAHFYVTPMVDMNLSYVAMTRHRDGADLYYATSQIRDRRTLVDILGREGDKDTSLDYELRAARELGLRELQIRAQEDVALERDGGRLRASERDMRELIAIAHASAREGETIRPTLQARLADALGVVLDADSEAATGLLIAENARGNNVTTFGALIESLRLEVQADADPLARDLAGNLSVAVEQRRSALEAVLALETPIHARRAAREALAGDAGVGPDPAGADPKHIEVRIVDVAKVVQHGQALLDSERPFEIAAGLLAVTGRRPVEILKTAKFDLTDDPHVVRFSGQVKAIGQKPIDIPVLADATKVVAALKKIRERHDVSDVANDIVNRQTAKQMAQLVRRVYSDELVPKDLRSIYAVAAFEARRPEHSRWRDAALILNHDPLDVGTGLSYTKFAGDRATAVSQIEAGRQEANRLLRDEIAVEQNPQMRSFLRERLVELGASSWSLAERDVELRAEMQRDQKRDVARVRGIVSSIGDIDIPAGERPGSAAAALIFTVDVSTPSGKQTVEVVAHGALAESAKKTLQIGQSVGLTAERISAAVPTGTVYQEVRLLESVRIERERKLDVAERMVVGWYRSAKAEQFPMAQGALLNVPAGEYAIVAERRGDRLDRMAIELSGTVSRVGQRSDVTLGMERMARRPITEEQFVGFASAGDGPVRIEHATAQIADNQLRVAREIGSLTQVPLAKGTLGVAYDGTHIRADRDHVVQRLASGELVRHPAQALSGRYVLGRREAISYSEGHAHVKQRDRGQSHDMSHNIG